MMKPKHKRDTVLHAYEVANTPKGQVYLGWVDLCFAGYVCGEILHACKRGLAGISLYSPLMYVLLL